MQKSRDVLSSWEEGRLSQLEAAALLGCSERQFRRYRDRFLDEGEEGLKDRRLGRPSVRAIAAAERAAMLELYHARHRGWTAKHFYDWGKRHHGFSWGYTWTKTQLHAAGLLERAPRRGAHRRKRERKPCAGMMLHQDGSRHMWLAGQGRDGPDRDDGRCDELDLLGVSGRGGGSESTFRACLETFSEHGLPCALYTDRASHYFMTPEAGGPVDKVHLTQVGRALSRLGVEHIAAYSPEARGRSERMFGTLQDRLVKELALAQLRDVATANRWIKEHYLPDHNRLFAHEPRVPDNAFVAVAHSDLVEALCIEHERIVSRDNTVSWEGLRLQIPESPLRAHYVKARVKVRQYPDGRLALFHGPRRIAYFESDGSPAISAQRSKAAFSAASRDGLETAKCAARKERRPPLTRPAPAATGLPCRKGLEYTA